MKPMRLKVTVAERSVHATGAIRSAEFLLSLQVDPVDGRVLPASVRCERIILWFEDGKPRSMRGLEKISGVDPGGESVVGQAVWRKHREQVEQKAMEELQEARSMRSRANEESEAQTTAMLRRHGIIPR